MGEMFKKIVCLKKTELKPFYLIQQILNKCNDALGDLMFDVIIDDGLHEAEAQMNTFANLFPRLKNGGYYFIEDIAPHNPLYDQWEETFSEDRSRKMD
jgi:hypothetical protein